ncbi:MAG: hypothetical protein U0X40_00440 [Ferruginibacter sp.]
MLDASKYQPAEITNLQNAVDTDFLQGFEQDFTELGSWYGTNMGAAFGAANRVTVTFLNDRSGGGESGPYSVGNCYMTLSTLGCNWMTGGTDAGRKSIRATFVHEMNHILESYLNFLDPSRNMPWNDSVGEALSRVAANLLHPGEGSGNINGWLACNPARDYTSAVEEKEFRQNWVATKFTGGTYKAGGYVQPCSGGYSFGCAMLFIYYLHEQLGFSMKEIINSGGGTLEQTYQRLTRQDIGGFAQFKRLLDVHFPGLNIYYKGAKPDNPFPLDFTNEPVAATARNNNLFVVAKMLDGRLVYNQKAPGKPFVGWQEFSGGTRTDVAPAAAMLGETLFVFAKKTDGKIIFNQAAPGGAFAGWLDMPGSIVTDTPLALAGRSDRLFVFAKKTDGNIVYNQAAPGQAFQGWQELPLPFHVTDAAAAGMMNNKLFVFIRGENGKIMFNQAVPGGIFTNWGYMPDGLLTDVPPAVAGWKSNLYVFARNRENGCIYYSQASPGAAFSPWQEVPGGKHTDISLSAAMQDNRLFVFANQQTEGRIYWNQMLAGAAFEGWNLLW